MCTVRRGIAYVSQAQRKSNVSGSFAGTRTLTNCYLSTLMKVWIVSPTGQFTIFRMILSHPFFDPSQILFESEPSSPFYGRPDSGFDYLRLGRGFKSKLIQRERH